MVIFMLEEGFKNQVQGGDEIKVCILSKYTEDALICPKVYTQIKYANEEYRPIEETDFNNNSDIERFVKYYEDVVSHIQVTDETKRIIKILDLINATEYLDAEGAFLKNKIKFVVDDERRHEQILHDIASHNFYVLEADKIAKELFNLPTSKSIVPENANKLLNENISKKLGKKINFLKSINVVRNKESNFLKIKRINGKFIGKMYLNIDGLGDTKLKVGRVGRCNVAAIPGYLIRRKNDIIFNEDEEGLESLVIIPIEKYTKTCLINYFNLEYFIFCKGCIVGITYIKNVESLF